MVWRRLSTALFVVLWWTLNLRWISQDPTWSPDGNYLAFRSTRTGQAHIWLSTADGDHQVRLTEGKGQFSNPDWSSPNAW